MYTEMRTRTHRRLHPMLEAKAETLATAIGGQVVTTMPQSRLPGVSVTLPDGRVAMIDENGGETFTNAAGMDAYFTDGDQTHIVASVEWINWDGSEGWCRGLSRLLGSPEYWHSG